jgi:hypothetical protein
LTISVYKKIENVFIPTGFLLAGIFVGAFIYTADEGRNTLEGIFRLDYFIPTALYSTGVILISYLIYHFLKKKLVKIVSFIISIILGVPIGLHLMIQVVKWSVYLYNWIDILVNRY